MTTSNMFDRMSIGNINGFIHDPATWIMNTYLDPREWDQRNPYMWRGKILENVLEYTLAEKAKGHYCTRDELIAKAHAEWLQYKNDNAVYLAFRIDLMKKHREQWEFIKSAISQILLISESVGNVIRYQQGLRKYYDNLAFKVTGILDFEFPEDVIEMKTKKEPEVEEDHIRQVVTYSDIVSKKPKVLILCPHTHVIYPVGESEAAKYLSQVLNAVHAIDMIRSNPTHDTFRMYVPLQYDSWDEKRKAIAREVWRL